MENGEVMSQETPKVTVLEFDELSPNDLKANGKQLATLAKRVGDDLAHQVAAKAEQLLQSETSIQSLTLWADPSNLVRVRMNEIWEQK